MWLENSTFLLLFLHRRRAPEQVERSFASSLAIPETWTVSGEQRSSVFAACRRCTIFADEIVHRFLFCRHCDRAGTGHRLSRAAHRRQSTEPRARESRHLGQRRRWRIRSRRSGIFCSTIRRRAAACAKWRSQRQDHFRAHAVARGRRGSLGPVIDTSKLNLDSSGAFHGGEQRPTARTSISTGRITPCAWTKSGNPVWIVTFSGEDATPLGTIYIGANHGTITRTEGMFTARCRTSRNARAQRRCDRPRTAAR